MAAEWPFLDLDACLMSGEGLEDDTDSLVTIVVRDGTVNAYQHDAMPFLSRFNDAAASFDPPDLGLAMMRLMDRHHPGDADHDADQRQRGPHQR